MPNAALDLDPMKQAEFRWSCVSSSNSPCKVLNFPDWQPSVSQELRASDLVGRITPGSTLRFRLSTRLAPTGSSLVPSYNWVEQVRSSWQCTAPANSYGACWRTNPACQTCSM